MRRNLLSWIATLIVATACWLPPAFGQSGRHDPNAEPKDRPPPALQYTVASVAIILVLVILCVPSRKRTMN